MAATLQSEFEMTLPMWMRELKEAQKGDRALFFQGDVPGNNWWQHKVIGPDAWLNALKRGYKVATRMMHSPGGGYCCLGVYAHVCGVDDSDLLNNMDFDAAPPWLTEGQTSLLAKMNDARRQHPIAEIERMLPLLRRQYRLWKKENA